MLPDVGGVDCGLQKICSVTWEFSSSTDGEKIITVYVTDSAGQESGKIPLKINVRPFDAPASECGNSVCESSESISICPGDCPRIDAICGNGVCDPWETEELCLADCEGISGGSGDACTSDAACGYKEACKSGTCRDVECTNNTHCGSNKKCSSNKCKLCPIGELGVRSC